MSVVILGGVGTAAYFLGWMDFTAQWSAAIPGISSSASEEPSIQGWPLTGIEVNVSNRPALAVEMASSADLGPYDGLEFADLVFEAVGEYGNSRITAVFHSIIPTRISPVLSGTNPSPWPHGFMNYLGDQDPSSFVAQAQGAGFPAPFCDFDTEYLGSTAQRQGEMVSMLSIHLSEVSAPMWLWDFTLGQWLRWDGDDPVVSLAGSQLGVTNVLILEIDPSPQAPAGSSVATTLGWGRGAAASGQMIVPITWQRDSNTSMWQFFDEYGEPLVLVPGTTWVELIPTTTAYWSAV